MNERQYDKSLDPNERSKLGAFFTPKKLSNLMHQMISKHIPNYKEDHLVWDSCCGTANLTRDYEFEDLILTTLSSNEIEIVKSLKLNENALIMQYDFLSARKPVDYFFFDTECYVPKEIEDKIKNTSKPLHFIINPPYGTGSNRRENVDNSGMTNNVIRDEMTQQKINSSDITFQFMYRCIEIAKHYKKDFYLTLFSKTNFVVGEQCSTFRDYFYSNMKFMDGFYFKGSHFNDVSSAFPVICSMWKQGKQESDSLDFDIYGDENDIIKDEFVESDHTYEEWVDLCYIYSLIETKNNCTAMRKVLWKNKKHRVQNHFFFYTRDQVKPLLNNYLLQDFNNDAHEPMYPTALIKKNLQHPLLDKVRKLWVESLKDRESWHIEHPEHHVNAWDAGVYQLKYMWKELYVEEWEDIYNDFKELRESLRYGVYKWGFLDKNYEFYNE